MCACVCISSVHLKASPYKLLSRNNSGIFHCTFQWNLENRVPITAKITDDFHKECQFSTLGILRDEEALYYLSSVHLFLYHCFCHCLFLNPRTHTAREDKLSIYCISYRRSKHLKNWVVALNEHKTAINSLRFYRNSWVWKLLQVNRKTCSGQHCLHTEIPIPAYLVMSSKLSLFTTK